MEFLRSFLRRHLAGKPMEASPNVGCFLRLVSVWKAPFAKLLICIFFPFLRCFMMSVDLNVLLQNTKGNYSQLCLK